MVLFKSINSETEIKNNIDRNLKLFRDFDQTSFYLDDGAFVFYKRDRAKTGINRIDINDSIKIFEKLILEKEKKIALISLGAGNSVKEVPFIERLIEKKFKVSYFGVDCSMSMLEISEETLKNSNFEKHLICADFSSESFKKEIGNLVKDFDIKIFALLGNTFGNVPQSYMADTLKNIVKKGDFLWLEVSKLNDYSDLEAGKNFEKAMEFLNDEINKNFLTYPLISKNIPLKKGELTLEMQKDNYLKSVNFKFGFLFNKKLTLKIEDDEMTFLPDETIDLLSIRKYYLPTLIDFIKERNFTFLHQNTKDTNASLFFKRK